MDRLNRIKEVILSVTALPGGNIDGDFSVMARDSDNVRVDGLTFAPDTVHVTAPLIAEPTERIVSVSPALLGLPDAPYSLMNCVVTPSQLKISGPPSSIQSVTILSTEPIPLKSLTATQEFQVLLKAIPGVIFRTLDGGPLILS